MVVLPFCLGISLKIFLTDITNWRILQGIAKNTIVSVLVLYGCVQSTFLKGAIDLVIVYIGWGLVRGGWWYIYVLMAKINGEGVIKSGGLYQLSKNLRGLWGNIWHFLG